VANITWHTFELMTSIDEVVAHYTTFLGAVESLVTGKLPTALISQDELGQTLLHVEENLKIAAPQWRIIHKEPIYYFSYGQYSYTRDDRNLYINLQVPLTHFGTAFNAFEVITFALPTHGSGKHASQIEELPHAFAIDQSEEYLFTMDKKELEKIGVTHTSQTRRLFDKVDKNTCLMSLYHDNSTSTMEKCKFNLKVGQAQEEVIHLGRGEYY
jgi:hypothetical protein